MKAFKRSMSILLAFGLLISSLFIGGDIKRVRAASVSYVEIKYGDDTSGNWGYILVPKGVSGPLQAGFLIHGLCGESNALSTVKGALNLWGDTISPKIYVIPMITYVNEGKTRAECDNKTLEKFRNYVMSEDNMKSIIAQMNDGTFDALIKNKGYNCSIDTDSNKGYFVAGWSMGGATAAYAGSKYRDVFPQVGILSPAPNTHVKFMQADPDEDVSKKYRYSKKENRILMVACSNNEQAEIYREFKGFYDFKNDSADYFLIKSADHNHRLFMTELFIFLYAVSNNGLYPSDEEIIAMYPTQIKSNKEVNTSFLDFPEGSDRSNKQNSQDKQNSQENQNTQNVPVIQSVVPSANVNNNTVDMGQYFNIAVTATGSNLSYQWMWSTDNSVWKASGCPGNKEATIQLEGKRPVVYYKCVVSNEAGSVESEVVPIYLANPVLISTVTNNTVKQGQNYMISSNVNDPKFEYKWVYDKHDGNGWIDSQVDGCTTGTLHLVGKNPVITYKCTITYRDTNGVFSVTSDPITITMAK